MKFNKMMFAVLAFSALAMFSCKQKPDDPVGPVGPGGGGGEDPVLEIPEVAAPAAGFATIVINIPANSECNGIAFKGNLNGDWSGEDTYVSETTAKASSADCIKFAPVPKAANWYQATFKMGEDGLKGKVCLIYKGDKDWQGQAINWEIIDDYTTAETSTSNDGNLEITAKGGLVYLKIGGWQNSECAKLEAYNLTFLTPAFCGEEFDIEIAGSYNSWGGNPTALKKEAAGKYTATIQAGPGTEFKIRGAGTGDWSREVEGYIKDEDKWTSVPNNVLGTDKNVTIDYSDAEKYRWNVCAGE